MRALCCVLTVVLLGAWVCGPALARTMLTQPGDTVESVQAAAEQAVQSSQMKITISTVGFDIDAGSEAESYLQQVSGIGQGGYFTASDAGQLTAAMSAAATGQTTYSRQLGPQITSPQDGQIAGPSTEIIGHTDPDALVVIWTVAYRTDNNEELRKVPGIRHRAEASGDFHFRIATPRIFVGADVRIRYEIHARVETPGYQGPETIINVYSR